MWFGSSHLHQALTNSAVECRVLWVNACAVIQASVEQTKLDMIQTAQNIVSGSLIPDVHNGTDD